MKTKIKLLHWTPRALCILSILFISMFALDSFEPGVPLGKQLIAFMMHLIPTYILTALLILAWKREKIGGILFIIIGAVLSPLVFMHNYEMNHSVGMSLGIIAMITFPFIFTGALFVFSARMKKMNAPVS